MGIGRIARRIIRAAGPGAQRRIVAGPMDHVLTELLQACEDVCNLLDQPDADERSATIARARAAIAQAQAAGVYRTHEPGHEVGSRNSSRSSGRKAWDDPGSTGQLDFSLPDKTPPPSDPDRRWWGKIGEPSSAPGQHLRDRFCECGNQHASFGPDGCPCDLNTNAGPPPTNTN